MMTCSLIPWLRLTRTGIPRFRVIRRALGVGENALQPGQEVPDGHICHKVRLRQLYEQRRIEPVDAPLASRQAHRRVTKTVTPVEVITTKAATSYVPRARRTVLPKHSSAPSPSAAATAALGLATTPVTGIDKES